MRNQQIVRLCIIVFAAALGLTIPRTAGAADSTAMPYLAVKTFGPGKVNQGDTVDLAILYENLGDGTASSVKLTSQLPDGVKIKETNVFGLDIEGLVPDIKGNEVTWNLGEVEAAETGELDVTLEITEDFSTTKLQFAAKLIYMAPGGQELSSLESNVTEIAVELNAKPPIVVTKNELIANMSISGQTIMVNTDLGVPYADVSGHWASRVITDMKARGLLTPFPGGRFDPEKPVSEREYFELVLLAQMYKEFGEPLTLSLELDRGAKVRVIIDNADANIHEEYAAKAFDKGGTYEIPITASEISFLAVTPGLYTLKIEAVDKDGDQYSASGQIQIIGSDIDLSSKYFETKKMPYSVGLRSLIDATGQAGIHTTYLRNLLDGKFTVNRFEAAKTLFNALGLIESGAALGTDPIPGFTIEVRAGGYVLGPNILNLALRPLESLGGRSLLRGRLNAGGRLDPAWRQPITRAESAALMARYIDLDPKDFKDPIPDPFVIARGYKESGAVAAQLPSGNNAFAIKVGHYVQRSAAETVWQWFTDRDIPVKIMPLYGEAGTYKTYTVVLGVYNVRADALRDMRLLESFFIPFGAPQLISFQMPQGGEMFSLPEDKLTVEKATPFVPSPVEYPTVGVSAQPPAASAIYELPLPATGAVTITPLGPNYKTAEADQFGYQEKVYTNSFNMDTNR